jgi:hypothetical protein
MEGSRSLFCDVRGIRFRFREYSAGQLEVMQCLLTCHSRIADAHDLWLRSDVLQLPFGVQLCTTLGGSYTLYAARMSQLLAISRKPPFTVGRCADASCRDANKRYQEQ